MYQDLLEMERKLDWTMTRKKVEVQDALARIPTVCMQFSDYVDASDEYSADNPNVTALSQSHSLWATMANRR